MFRSNGEDTPIRAGVLGALVVAILLILTQPMAAQNFKVIYTFSGTPDAAAPIGRLVRGGLGEFFGTSFGGGSFNTGSVFEATTAGQVSVLYSFCPPIDCQEEGSPNSSLAGDGKGTLYGTAIGGKYGNGFVFALSSSGQMTVLWDFTGGKDGGSPIGPLLVVGDNLYGVTQSGGENLCDNYSWGCGLIYKLTKNGQQTVLYNFPTSGYPPYPLGSLIRDKHGNLYGQTSYGGPYRAGTVFELTADGRMITLHTFGRRGDGFFPSGSLSLDDEGNLFGETEGGGKGSYCEQRSCGVLYKLSRKRHEIILHTFSGGLDGMSSSGNLVPDSNGNFYGTTLYGGGHHNCENADCGTVFRVDTKGNEKVLYRFTGGSDGGLPVGLSWDGSGNLLGVTAIGGQCSSNQLGCGVVFDILP